MSLPVQENIVWHDERDFRIEILEKAHFLNNVPGAGVSPHYISNQQGAALQHELAERMRVDPRFMNLVQDNAPVYQVAAYLQGINQALADIPQYPVNSQRIVPQSVDIHSPNNGFYSNFGENIKNLFSASFEWFTAKVTNVFSRFGVGEQDNHSDEQMHNIEQRDDHSLSWSDLINNLSGLLFNTISNLSGYICSERQGNSSEYLTGEEYGEEDQGF